MQNPAVFERLNVFSQWKLCGHLQVIRNGSSAIANTFEFATPVVTFRVPSPSLTHDSFDLGTLTPAKRTIEGYLDAFFTSLLSGAGSAELRLTMNAAYCFEIDGIAQTMPLFRAVGVPIVAGWTSTPEWIEEIGRHVRPESAAAYTFEITISVEDDGVELPLLAIRELFLDAACI